MLDSTLNSIVYMELCDADDTRPALNRTET